MLIFLYSILIVISSVVSVVSVTALIYKGFFLLHKLQRLH